ncbi:MAG: tautomerase family protein [Rubrivivax sp.]|nr:tautomerase family protein [Rubrivivax sp.]
MTDRFQRVLALTPADLVFDPHDPESAGSPQARDTRFASAEVLWSAGRSVKVKKQFFQHPGEAMRDSDLEPERLLLVFKETTWENWSFAGGRLPHV